MYSTLLRQSILYAFLFLGAFIQPTIYGQEISFKKYGVAEGLPEEIATYFVQDKNGYIWIATQNGLVKFDGYEMKVFRPNPKDPDALHFKSGIGGLLVAKDGTLWIGGWSKNGGLASYHPDMDKFTNYKIDFKDENKTPYPSCYLLFEDVTGKIWFVSAGSNGQRLLCFIDPDTKKVSRHSYIVRRKTSDLVLNFQLAESKRDSSVWLNTIEKNLYRYNRTKDTFELQIKKGEIIPGTQLRDSILDINSTLDNNYLMLNTKHRLLIFDPIERKVSKEYFFTSRDSIFWGGAFEDYYGNYWVSSHENLSIINNKTTLQRDLKFGEGKLDFDFDGEVIQIIPMVQNEEQIIFDLTVSYFDTDFIQQQQAKATLIYSFENDNFAFYDFNFNNKELVFSRRNSRRNFLLDDSGLIWMGTRPNLYKESPKADEFGHISRTSPNVRGLPSDTIFSLFEDSQKRLWLGTAKGISLKENNNSFKTFDASSSTLLDTNLDPIFQIVEDSDQTIWTHSLIYGLSRLPTDAEKFQHVELPDFNPRALSIIYPTKDGKLWVSILDQGIYVLDNKTAKILDRFGPENQEIHGLTSTIIQRIYQDSQGVIWLGDGDDNDQGIFRYDEKNHKFKHFSHNANNPNSLINNEISFITEDDLNRIWVGTDGGVCMYDRDKDQFLINTDALNISSVWDYAKSLNGKMWIATYSGGGLAEIGPDINDVTLYGEEAGLLHNDTRNLTFDNQGKLWATTERGVSVLDTLTKTFSNYAINEGYSNLSEINSFYHTSDGTMWFASDNGLYYTTPLKFMTKDSTTPIVNINGVKIMDSLYAKPDGKILKRALSASEEIKLEHWQKDLTFNFVGIHYLQPEKNLYSWKLENYDKDWSTPSTERQASYTNLSPGIYTFRVKASNADGVWNEQGASLRVIIAPPWWLSWWAYLLYAIIAGALIFWLVKVQKEKARRNEREKTREKELAQAKEIEVAYENLKSTQAQLIQSEKMASLGELTAGIAHEIQNPLNFVNNFSDLNQELVEELEEELSKGDIKEASAIAKDIKSNEQKISHHGRRADSIVKGMLQHSRQSSGEKELTDINKLAEEYLNLAYHGLRAKDKSFNATIKTELDRDIGKINVVPQEIGRVLLNIINNAFYAVTEKKQTAFNGYEPTVELLTYQNNGQVKIKVKDNGGGMPKQVVDKIFQPFFTTKPTGQGTGLGLSMSYDIIKAHGGKLLVSSQKNQGSVFTIQLPK